MDDKVCIAEINIGDLSATAVKSNKRHSKLAAAKHLLRIIDGNIYLKDKFFYFLKNPNDKFGQLSRPMSTLDTYQGYQESRETDDGDKDIQHQLEPKQLEENIITNIKEDEQLLDEDRFEVDTFLSKDYLELKNALNTLDANLKPADAQQQDVNQIFMQVSEVIKALMPGGYIKVIPLGSYLLGCMRKNNMIVDCLLFDSSHISQDSGSVSPAEVNLTKLNELFQERKTGFQLINNHYQLYEVY